MSQLALDSALALRCEASVLADALKPVLPFAQGGLAVYSGVQINATADDQLILEATNGDQRVITTLSAAVTAPGRVIVPAKVLDAFLRSVKGKVELAQRDVDLTISCGSTSLDLRTIEEADWPLFAALDGPEFEFTPDMWSGVKRVLHAQGGTEDKSPSRHCVRFETGAIVAQSTSRGACFEVPKLKTEGTNVPGSFLATILKLIEPKDSVFVRFGERLASFRSGATEWVCRPVKDAYPNWRAIFEQEKPHTLVVARDDLITALARTGLLPEASGWKRMTMNRLGDNELVLTAAGPDIGTITDVIPCSGTYEGEQIIMDVREFRATLDNSVEDELVLHIADAWKAIKLDEGPWKALLMPRRPGGPGAPDPPTPADAPTSSKS